MVLCGFEKINVGLILTYMRIIRSHHALHGGEGGSKRRVKKNINKIGRIIKRDLTPRSVENPWSAIP